MQAFGARREFSGSSAEARAGAEIQLAGQLNLPGFVMTFSRNEEIFGEEESADFVYKLVSGAARIVRMLGDGRRQVAAFHLPGEVFGFELTGTHRFTAEAVVDCQVALIRRSHVRRAVGEQAKAAEAMWAMAAGDLARLQDHMLLLGRKGAAERVGAFLLEMSERAGGDDEFELPMCRADVADYLGLTIETVSRTLTQFERDGVIGLPTFRSVVLRRRGALAQPQA